MKKVVGVLSLIVMLLTQIITPYTYAVSGEVETVVEQPSTEDNGSPAQTAEDTLAPSVEPGNSEGGGGR